MSYLESILQISGRLVGRTLFLTVFAGTVLFVGTQSTAAATLTVTSAGNSGAGTLRDTVAAAATGDTINFSVTGTITLTSGEIAINKNLIIQGPGASNLTISGNNNSRIFYVEFVTLSLSGLTLSSGNGAGFDSSGLGGAIFSRGSLNITDCVFSSNNSLTGSGLAAQETGNVVNINNSTFSSNTTSSFFGSCIFTFEPTLNITGSTISGNTANGSGNVAGVYAFGGLSITNSTISGNTVATGANKGGGVFFEGGTATITNTTITNNSVPVGTNNAGGIRRTGGTITVSNSIIAGNIGNNTVPDVSGAFVSGGNNLIGNVGTVINFTGTGDQTGTGASPRNPLLGPLANNGGITQTHALLANSTAVNAGNSSIAPATDQRGASRIGNADIGSFELNSSANGGNYVATLPSVALNGSYNVLIAANNAGFTYSVTGGALPNGINLIPSPALAKANWIESPSAVVALVGTPTQAGTFNFTIRATDGVNTNFTDYSIVVNSPTAASVSLSGRVLTAAVGRGLRNAIVTLTNQNGAVRQVITSARGYYRFDDVESGQTYIIGVRSRRFAFNSQVISIADTLTGVDFIPQ